ncbi:hypothetical protein [Clostridium omnivorum]|uniref:Zn-finger domain-containing protein n=1 Tax=Clostridium omnivorum TaxID=1604902 RepID=A0ABQ5NC76_9CLOT|nr:hypothetical protein [Clostridium sp. E14]GLC32677.1 Zn-finger domain-containing protein [Clostridium sp. E14]
MEKKCIFNKEIMCSDCGECDICDLDKNKICDNCGRCLENTDNKDYRTLDVDTIIDEDYSQEEDFDVYLEKIDSQNENMERVVGKSSSEFIDNEIQDEWILIDDIPGLKEMLEENEIPKGYAEEFPGLMVFNKKG